MAKKITCVVTGKTKSVSDTWYDNKISEFGGESNLLNMYTSREARTLIKRGYSIEECRSMLKVEKKMNDILPEYLEKIKTSTDDEVFSKNSNVLKSSDDVINYIRNLKETYDIRA